MKITRIVKAPDFPHGGALDFPPWVGEACVGLCLGVSEWKVPGDIMIIEARTECPMPCDEHYLILPEDLIRELALQQPKARSKEASEWINENDFWAGPLSISKEKVLVMPGVDMPLDTFRARCREEFTLLVKEEGRWNRSQFEQVDSFVRCTLNYDLVAFPWIALLFGRHPASDFKHLKVFLGQFAVKNVTGCYHPALPFAPQTL